MDVCSRIELSELSENCTNAELTSNLEPIVYKYNRECELETLKIYIINAVSVCVGLCLSVCLSVRPREISGTERYIAALLSLA